MEDRGESQSSGIATVEQAMAELDRREAARAEQAEADEAETQEAEVEEPEQDLETEAVDDDSDDVATEDESEPEEEATLTVEFDGKALEIPKGTPKALVEGVQKLAADLKADYTRKTQETAAEKAAIQQAKQAFAQQAQQQQVLAQALMQLGKEVLGEEPPLELAQQDPQEYLVRQGLYKRRMELLNQSVSQFRQNEMRQQHERLQAQQQQLAEEFPRMVKAMPELADEGKRAAFTQKAIEVASGYGFSADDVTAITDHRTLLLLRDLAEFKQLKAQMAKAKEKVAKAPPKVIQTAATTQTQQKSSRTKEAKQQFLKSGRTMKDVEAWIRKTS